ncbi:MAG: T9SS C-terminal target domain-containing protein [Ignavibacteriae bacterium]|nr:MAG: T9SS C-terminal target domain-containing protein [Ignavibacteriota bacterium]
MLENNKYMSLIAGPYVNYVSSTFNQASYTPGGSGNIKIRFRNKGVLIANNSKIILTPGNANVTIPTQQYIYNLAAFTMDSATFNFNIGAGAPNNCYVPCTLTIKQDTATVYSSGIYIPVGTPVVTAVFTDLANNFANWTTDGTWGTTTSQFYSAPSSFTESPAGNYGNNLNISMAMTNAVNVSAAPVVFLSFYHRYATELNWDFCYAEISSDNGNSWHTVASYTGSLSTWTQQTYNVSQYINAPYMVKVRFRFTSDDNTIADGWYVDNVVLSTACVGTPVGLTPNNNNPLTFALAQNFPNPFNPATSIKYQIPKAEFVTIKVFDIMGKEVATLVNEKKEAGYFDVVFDGTNVASGIYFYKIEAGSFVDTKKMILVK